MESDSARESKRIRKHRKRKFVRSSERVSDVKRNKNRTTTAAPNSSVISTIPCETEPQDVEGLSDKTVCSKINEMAAVKKEISIKEEPLEELMSAEDLLPELYIDEGSSKHNGYKRAIKKWTKKFIEIIESKPILHDKTHSQFFDPAARKRTWFEVCEAMVEGWKQLNSSDKRSKYVEFHRRWRHITKCFKREFNKEEKERHPQGSLGNKTYAYFDQLKFLIPSLMNLDETLNEEGKEEDDEEIEESRHTGENDTKKKQNVKDINEDRLFLMSLVPYFNKFTVEQKLEAKIQFLQVIKSISKENCELKNGESSLRGEKRRKLGLLVVSTDTVDLTYN